MKIFLLKIKHFFQKIFKGYSDEELWNLDVTLSKNIFKYLDAFIKLDRMGYPLTLEKDKAYIDFDNIYHKEKWEADLNKMRNAFFYIKNGEHYDLMGNDIKNKEIEEGLKLFSERFMSLWD